MDDTMQTIDSSSTGQLTVNKQIKHDEIIKSTVTEN
ncbi:hypothetical protein P305_07700 [Xylella fastidiosa subsp. fastidiosa Mus-1]|nr:hypothetical protein P305_07700 [Xylella fastidiosa subsp. fastidiosa Mus-1]